MYKIILGLLFACIINLYVNSLYGEDSHKACKRLNSKLVEYNDKLKSLEEENQRLLNEIILLKEDPLVQEEQARSLLGFIKTGETYYQIIGPID